MSLILEKNLKMITNIVEFNLKTMPMVSMNMKSSGIPEIFTKKKKKSNNNLIEK